MATIDEITIHPHDLQNILEELSAQQWSQGQVIIRDTGTKYIIRDTNENLICEIKQSHEEPG